MWPLTSAMLSDLSRPKGRAWEAVNLTSGSTHFKIFASLNRPNLVHEPSIWLTLTVIQSFCLLCILTPLLCQILSLSKLLLAKKYPSPSVSLRLSPLTLCLHHSLSHRHYSQRRPVRPSVFFILFTFNLFSCFCQTHRLLFSCFRVHLIIWSLTVCT